MFERFTDRARLITVEAQEAAVARASVEVEPYHFLLGICADDGWPRELLAECGVEYNSTMAYLEDRYGRVIPPSHPLAEQRPYSSKGKALLAKTLTISTEMGRNYIGAEHLILATFQPVDPMIEMILRHGGAHRQTIIGTVQEWIDTPAVAG